jgi:sialate O-acetylesterase
MCLALVPSRAAALVYEPPAGTSMWDAWIFCEGDEAHLFYLRSEVGRRWNSIGHAVSKDMVHWRELPPIPTQGPEGSWDHALTLTGCTVKHGDTYYLFYGAANRSQQIGLMTSKNLIDWEKCPGNPVSESGGPHYGDGFDWRDLSAFYDAGHKQWHGVLCARARSDGTDAAGVPNRRPDAKHGQPAIGHLVSSDLIHWEQRPPLFTSWRWGNLEVPIPFTLDGRHYLLFSHGGALPDTSGRKRAGGTFYLMADSFDGPYRVPEEPLLLGWGRDQLDNYVGRVVMHQGELLLYHHTCGGPGEGKVSWLPGRVADASVRIRFQVDGNPCQVGILWRWDGTQGGASWLQTGADGGTVVIGTAPLRPATAAVASPSEHPTPPRGGQPESPKDPSGGSDGESVLRELVPAESPAADPLTPLLHGLFADGMVLQRDREVPIWGWGPDGANVEVRFGSTVVGTEVRGNSWMVKLPPMPASDQGRELTVVCRDRRALVRDVLVGEVWLCSGQSNMQWEMKLDLEKDPQRGADIRDASNQMVRFFKVDRAVARLPRRDIPPVRDDIHEPWSNAFLGNRWRPATPEWVPHVGATPFYFACEMQARLKCPVGILICARGGSSIDCWVPAEVIRGNPWWGDKSKALQYVEGQWPEFIGPQVARWRSFKERFPTLHDLWLAQQAGERIAPPPQPAWPTCFYNAMLHPLAPCAVRGVVWYQGESDARGAETYTDKMAGLISAWRRLWGQPDMPFVFAQLPGFAGHDGEPPDADNLNWAAMRVAQARVPKMVPGAFMACLIDAGMRHEIHPVRKDVAGKRLALVALKEVYGTPINAHGPMLRKVTKKDGALELTFDHDDGGLVAKRVDLDGFVVPRGAVTGFTIRGRDSPWVAGTAHIQGDNVTVASPRIAEPVAVRYAWADFPLANLYNGDGLPAPPFESALTTDAP